MDRACRGAPTIADGGYQGAGLLIPHRAAGGGECRPPPDASLTVEHTLSRQATLGIARLHNLALTG